MSEITKITDSLGEAFDRIISKHYGHCVVPEPILTPFNIRHLDALLGGGIVSSGPVMFSSTPETGKSTIAFQFCSIFQNAYDNGVIVYLDIEGSGNLKTTTEFRTSRLETFKLNPARFKHEAIVLTIPEVFQLIEQLIDIKQAFEDKTKKEFFVCVIWDSIPATPGSKTSEVDEPERMIGHKARQLTFSLEKYIGSFKFHRITFIAIDQIRAKISVDGPYAQSESTVGEFKNFKAATNIFALQHNIQQWLFFSKKNTITDADGMGLNGWYLDVKTEKNKITSSKYEVRCVFDTHCGIDKFWSEYTFLNELTPTEKRIYKTRKPKFQLPIVKSGNRWMLSYTDPNDSSVSYTSEPFFKKNAKTKYQTDKVFAQWFDFIINQSVQERITNGFMKLTAAQRAEIEAVPDADGSVIVDNSVSASIDNTHNDINDSIPTDGIIETTDTTIGDSIITDESGDMIDTNTGEIIGDNDGPGYTSVLS